MAWSTPAQKQQWRLRHALGYTLAMRGYLNCWLGLLKAAGVPSYKLQSIDMVLTVIRLLEADLRSDLQNIPKTPKSPTK